MNDILLAFNRPSEKIIRLITEKIDVALLEDFTSLIETSIYDDMIFITCTLTNRSVVIIDTEPVFFRSKDEMLIGCEKLLELPRGTNILEIRKTF